MKQSPKPLRRTEFIRDGLSPRIQLLVIFMSTMLGCSSNPLVHRSISASRTEATPSTMQCVVEKQLIQHRWRIRQKAGDQFLYGYINDKGEMAIKPTFDYAQPFHEGLAWVFDHGNWKVIRPDGQTAFKTRAEIRDPQYFSEGFSVINVGGKVDFVYTNGGVWFYIDAHGNDTIGKRITTIIDSPLKDFSEGRAAFRIDQKWGVLNSKGEVIVPPKYDKVSFCSEGMAAVKSGNRWGFIDRDGHLIIPIQFDDVAWFSEGVASVSAHGEFLIIDKEGKKIPSLSHFYSTSDGFFSEGLAAVEMPQMGMVPAGTRCVECRAILTGLSYGEECENCGSDIESPRRLGYVDHGGKRVIAPRFSQAYPFRQGLAAVRVGDKDTDYWGFIDKKGSWVIPPKYLDAPERGFDRELALVALPNEKDPANNDEPLTAYIDRTGRVVWSERTDHLP